MVDNNNPNAHKFPKYPKDVPINTKKFEYDEEVTRLLIGAELEGRSQITVIVKQDLNGDGDADRGQKVVARDGVNWYRLNSFEEGGEQYWAEVHLQSPDGQHSPKLSKLGLATDQEALFIVDPGE